MRRISGWTALVRDGRLGAEVRAEMFREQRNQTRAIIGANTILTALLLAAFQLL